MRSQSYQSALPAEIQIEDFRLTVAQELVPGVCVCSLVAMSVFVGIATIVTRPLWEGLCFFGQLVQDQQCLVANFVLGKKIRIGIYFKISPQEF